MLKDYPDVMSIEQMCEILSISTKTGYRILREGKICCLKVGRAYRIPKAHLFT
ncbi:MAG: helix-turn-helix domain-containing protein, partial [Clostridiales bacterium]|nr:helix-turn-helix domain-containing protein [Clostridiales bacterium]